MPRPADLEQRLAFLNLDERDSQRLADLRPILEKNARHFVSAFYRHLLSFESTRALLRDPSVKERLLFKQEEYLLSLCGPTFDDAFHQQRRRIGETHDRVGLEPRWYLGAYAMYLSLLLPLIAEAFPDDRQRSTESMVALTKLVFLDAEIAMERYIERHQRELRYLADELGEEQRKLSRDFETQRLELRQTEDRARTAEELASVANLVAGLAHEIGTPMGVIQGHAKLLESAVEGENAQWRLRTIQEQIARISRIIGTLLDMARPRRTRRVPVQLGSLLEASLSFVEEKLSRCGISVVKRLQPVSTILGDAERLQQLFLNLFLNAADAMPDGGELRVELSPDGDDGVMVAVTDTGCGMPPDVMARIFEPFFTTKAGGQGHGLGLMVARGIASDHGGRLDVSSREGHGTRFTAWLPIARGGSPQVG
jgi:signal transduction histidine kinase